MKAHKKKTISKILKLKDSRKKELELEVKKAADKVDEEEAKLNDLKTNYQETLRYFNEKNENGSLDINNINSYYDFFACINGKIAEQKKVHDRCRTELTSLKDSLVNAHQEKKMYEILTEKAVTADKKENALCEQKEADFNAISRRMK